VVPINYISLTELQDTVVGLDAEKAAKIVRYREKHGKFKSVEEVVNSSAKGKSELEPLLQSVLFF
jgi:competence protein ComEA